MTTEANFIDLMRGIATDPSARGLSDDAAVLDFHGHSLVLTHDVMVEGVHWLAGGDAADVAWKLLSVNLSDLAAKGAKPLGVLLGFSLGDDQWDRDFAAGLRHALTHYDVPLLGGDTVKGDGLRHLGLTAIGATTHDPAPSRSGARAGDVLYVTGTIGDAMAGFELASSGNIESATLINAYQRPLALLQEGQLLAPYVHAMMDISDGLLLDASRMAVASGLAVSIDLAQVPLSPEFVQTKGNDQEMRSAAARWGDDYQLLFAGPVNADWPVQATAVGRFSAGEGLVLEDAGEVIPLPDNLGYLHG